ncbi:potassium/sodium hyperpolarization-activated cyclic nucleotide-gated channel 3-like isoform X4 [Dermacentor andersoni]|uniref:potassium/sodium hyperpolarization-activated cyclic nucleotide-gated channel 3-like isoform X4 n=1 Tax=Dermacentor andersoni TaxID=34620 RepID=UPI0024178DCE|nr:potassium/sodium hyperpolarization-activated cyclic nucleotide-gated channel 1-like isoform X3 [Dermacentor andersoni]
MSLTSRNLDVPPSSVSSLLPTSRNLKGPQNSHVTTCSTPSPMTSAAPAPAASAPSPLHMPWDTPVSPASASPLLGSSRSSPMTPRSPKLSSRRSSVYSLRAPMHSQSESERSLDARANHQLRAIKSAIKKLLTAASRRQYSGLDFKKQAHTEHRCIVHPRSKFRKWWDGFIVLLLVMNLVLVPLHLGFFPTTGIEWALYSLYSDFMLLADMLLNFRTGIDDRKQGIVIMDPAEIKQHYLKGWFPVDLLSSLPLDFIIWTWPTKHHRNLDIRSRLSQLAKLLSFVKLIKISRLFRYGGRTEQIMFYQTTGVYLQLGNILALIFLAVHWHACLQFFVGNLMGFPPQSWISIAKLQDKHWWEQYSWAVHNTVSLMMTNNYGLAQKTGLLVEEWIQVMGMFFGALWQALLLGYGANLLAHKDFTKNVQRERMQEVEEFMSYYDLPEWLRARIRSHLNAQQMYLHDKDILSSLSGTLREEVLRHNYSATLTRVPFFAQADPDFTNAIAERLNAEYYQPRDVIARRGTMGQKVYFVRSGVANALSEKQELLDTYTTGDYFGQSCLMGAKVRQDNVVAANHCSVLTLLATDFHEVMGRFPSVRGIFQTLLFEMNSQEHAERRRLQLMRRPSSVLILPELRRMGAITPSTETTDESTPAHSILDMDTKTKSPTSSGGGCLAVPNTSHTPSTCQLSPPLEETDDSPSAADSGRENRDPEDQGRRDGSDVGGRGSQCKQS